MNCKEVRTKVSDRNYSQLKTLASQYDMSVSGYAKYILLDHVKNNRGANHDKKNKDS